MAEKRKWKIRDVGTLLMNSVRSFLKGELIMKLNLGKYFPQILYTFFLFAMVILFSLGVDATLVKIEKNKLVLTDLEVLHTQKSYELQELNRRTTVKKMLRQMGSAVTEPDRPAIRK